jgi:hypothetical protein
MPTLILENVPPDLYEQLKMRAESKNQPLPKEALDLLTIGLKYESANDEKQPPAAGALRTAAAQPRLPEYIPLEEGPPPYDIPRPPSRRHVNARRGNRHLPNPLILDDQLVDTPDV